MSLPMDMTTIGRELAIKTGDYLDRFAERNGLPARFDVETDADYRERMHTFIFGLPTPSDSY